MQQAPATHPLANKLDSSEAKLLQPEVGKKLLQLQKPPLQGPLLHCDPVGLHGDILVHRNQQHIACRSETTEFAAACEHHALICQACQRISTFMYKASSNQCVDADSDDAHA